MNLYLLTYEHVLSHGTNHWCYYVVADETAARAQERLENSGDLSGKNEEFRSSELLDDCKDSQVSFLSYTKEPINYGTL